jgi:plasmid stabilization system protein ParE
MRLEWTPDAVADLHQAVRWMRRQSAPAARDMADDIIAKLYRASQRPRLYKRSTKHDVPAVSLPKWHKTVFYEVRPDQILFCPFVTRAWTPKDTRQC